MATGVDPYAASRGFNNMVQLGRQRREDDAAEVQQGLANQERNRLAQIQGEQLGMQKERFGMEQQDAHMKGQEWLGQYAARAKASGNPQAARGIMREALQAAAPQKLAEFDALPDEQVAQQIEQFAAFAPAASGPKIGAFQPGDYTPESVAQFQQSNNPADLKRYISPQRDPTPSFQNVTRTLPDGSTEMGTFNTRTGEKEWSGQKIPAGTQARVAAQGRSEGDAAGDRAATQVKNTRAFDTFNTAMGNIASKLDETVTGPLMGRGPALTSGQQTAEGAISIAIPTMKELFRQAGEGTFTQGDQQILVDMLPTRRDHPEARKAKLQMINSMVRAKLGIQDQQPQAPGGGGGGNAGQRMTPEQASQLPPGTSFIGMDGVPRVRH